ncbi:MAG: response regulator [Micropepsaceae bacterium]
MTTKTQAADLISLTGRHLLLVEDEMMIALDLADVVGGFGCTFAMAGRVAKAISLIANAGFDAAVLDVNLAGEKVYAVADELNRLGIPLIFTTGYGEDGVLAQYRHHVIVSKPYTRIDLYGALVRVLGPARV